MIDAESRYHGLETLNYRRADGADIAYVSRRFIADGRRLAIALETSVGAEDRLDQIAARHLGDPLLFWRICDANNALSPWELVMRPGESLRIPVPDFLRPEL